MEWQKRKGEIMRVKPESGRKEYSDGVWVETVLGTIADQGFYQLPGKEEPKLILQPPLYYV